MRLKFNQFLVILCLLLNQIFVSESSHHHLIKYLPYIKKGALVGLAAVAKKKTITIPIPIPITIDVLQPPIIGPPFPPFFHGSFAGGGGGGYGGGGGFGGGGYGGGGFGGGHGLHGGFGAIGWG